MEVFRNPAYLAGFTYVDQQEFPAMTHCGDASYGRSHRSLSHSHPGFEFIYLSRGSSTRFAGGQEIRQKMGDVYIAYPNEPHEVQCRPDEEGHQIWVGLRLNKVGSEGVALANYLRRHKPRVLPRCQSIEPVLQGIIRQVATNGSLRREATESYLRTLCVLLRQAAQQRDSEDTSTPGPAWPYTYVVQKAIFFMENNLDRRLSLAEIASAAGATNPARFCTQFHQEVKVPPAAHHLLLRLASARKALLQPSSTVTTVAMEHGFSSAQHFCGTFRRTFGLTATAWVKGSKSEEKTVDPLPRRSAQDLVSWQSGMDS